MKPATAVCSGLAIAILSGAAGFYWGRSSQDAAAITSGDITHPFPTRGVFPARTGMSRSDLEGLVRRLDEESDPFRRFSTALQHMEAWVATDPKAALSWLLRQPTTGRRNEIIRLALAQWAEQAPADAAAWAFDHLGGNELNNTLIRMAEQWVRTDPQSAARWFAVLPDPAARAGPLEGLFFLWGAQDAPAARAFLEGETVNNDDRAIVTQAMLAGWAKSDPQGASLFSLETSRRTGNPGLFANTLANWATVDVVSSAAWLDQHVPGGPERAAAMPELAGMFAHHDPSSGLDWIDRLPTDDRPPAINSFAAAWAQDDPAAAARWLAASGDASSTIDPETLAAVVIGFLAADEPAFEQWKNSLPPGPLKQQAEELSQRADEP